MKRTDSLRMAWKQAIKETIWLLNRHRPGPRKNICLFSTRRGGSTLLMDVVAANRGVRYIDQPFSLYGATPGQLAHLPLVEDSQFILLDDVQERQVHRYLSRLFDGSLSVRAPWEWWRPDFDFVSDRLVLKILDAKGLIDWIDTHFEVHIVYSTRHPIPTALSIIRNTWSLTARAYLRHEGFVTRYLDDARLAYCWDLLKRGSQLQQHVMNWALENLIPLRLLPDRPHWLYLSYEEMLLAPERALEWLADRLDLSDLDRMRRRIHRASRSTKKLHSTFSSEKTAREMIEAWQHTVSAEDARAAFDVLDTLEISLYRPDSPLPTRRTLLADTN
ncbi:MAG: hypothetical protein KatS3mg042_0258 [Rhodothermaceae bacterium]|nr:MAG: hypothetical protein KatS3mg042_0258 [Rhodothermaceae bacterium]